MDMQQFRPGPPYFYVCAVCGHRFSVSNKLMILLFGCPRCSSRWVREDGRYVK